MLHRLVAGLLCCLSVSAMRAQSFTPISVTGFNHDIIADVNMGGGALITTDTAIDATNHVMYSQNFGGGFGFPAGLPNSGAVADAGNQHQYQLAPYTGNNALLLMRGVSRTLSLQTPGKYTKLSLLGFSTEGSTLINVSIRFSDNTVSSYLTNYTLADWFFNTTNVVVSGFGRINRVSSGIAQDGSPGNPRFYYTDITLSCADQQKTITEVLVSNVTTAGSNAPWPASVIMAVSGQANTQAVSVTTQSAQCPTSSNGTATLNITGNTGPWTVSWNTTPAQSGLVASGLAVGNYTATVTNAGGCVTTVPVTIASVFRNDTAIAAPATICQGVSTVLTASNPDNPVMQYTWSPGNLVGPTITVSPTTNTTYTVTSVTPFGPPCVYSATVTVTVNPTPAAPVVLSSGPYCQTVSGATLTVQGPAPGATYNWYSAVTGGSALYTGNQLVTGTLSNTTTYYVEAVGANSCVQTTRTPGTVVVNQPPPAPAATAADFCPGDNASFVVTSPSLLYVYNWYSAATGGSPLATGVAYTAGPLAAATTYFLEATIAPGCGSTRTAVTANPILPLPAPVVTVAGVTNTTMTFSWQPVAGATGYEVQTSGSSASTAPSSGATGTTHTVAGLTLGQTVTLIVRALGTPACRTSVASAPATGTVPATDIWVPSAFTPNGDGKNETLKVYGAGIVSLEFRVFDQWGNQVYRGTDAASGWDGTRAGEKQPSGVYMYAVKAVLAGGTERMVKGAVNLIR